MDNQKAIYAVFLLALIPLLGLCAYGGWLLYSYSIFFTEGSVAFDILAQKIESDNISTIELAESLKDISQAELKMGEHTEGLINSYYALVVSAVGIAVLQVKLLKSALKNT